MPCMVLVKMIVELSHEAYQVGKVEGTFGSLMGMSHGGLKELEKLGVCVQDLSQERGSRGRIISLQEFGLYSKGNRS